MCICSSSRNAAAVRLFYVGCYRRDTIDHEIPPVKHVSSPPAFLIIVASDVVPIRRCRVRDNHEFVLAVGVILQLMDCYCSWGRGRWQGGGCTLAPISGGCWHGPGVERNGHPNIARSAKPFETNYLACRRGNGLCKALAG